MNAFLDFLNSDFGVLISGAVISGLFVQYITSRWQQRSWIFQQQYTAGKTMFEKELDQKYRLLEDINTAVAAVLAHSRVVLAAYVKSVSGEQLNQQITSYNDAVLKWEADFWLYSIRLRTLFHYEATLKEWESIKARRDELDVAIYEVTGGSHESTEGAFALLEKLSDSTVVLSRHMIAEIQAMKSRTQNGKELRAGI
jgi:hypothetical protein